MKELIETPVTVLHIIVSLFLVLVVLLQPGKSGGLGAFSGAAAQQVFGGRGAGNLLTRLTWISATTFFLTSVTLAWLSTNADAAIRAAGDGEPTALPAPVLPSVARPTPPPVASGIDDDAAPPAPAPAESTTADAAAPSAAPADASAAPTTAASDAPPSPAPSAP